MCPSNQMGNGILPGHGMESGFAPAPSVNTKFVMQLQYPADSSGQLMMNPTSYPAAPSTLNPLLFPGYLNAQGQVTSQVQATDSAPAVAQATTASTCTQAGCRATFSRDTDRIRHEASVHSGGRHFCHVQGCPKNHGAGYRRRDKLTEHLWKKHANLGHFKRVQ